MHNRDVEALNREIESHKSDSNSVSIRSIIQSKNEKFIQKIKENFIDNDQIKCCRDITYYFDLLNAIIKSPNVFSRYIQDDVINKLEEQWKEIIQVKNIDIYDYNNYLVDKWKKIIEYTSTYYGGIYIKIENDSMGIIEKYDDFLKFSYFICDSGLNKLNTDDITISTDVNSLINSISLDKITSNKIQEGCFNKSYIELLKIKTSNIQRINNMLTIGISLLEFALILIFLYRFSPLGNLLRRCTKKNIDVGENTSEEMHELYENSENGRQYISYHSVSH
ncbi:PIR Superfamily Protein [Plasmodium ovale curtisi]|uniref:PIR Superfamily Protein n=1 Tax=Plasmodium ovale curtisi TaxID=864141 RepID=A0A1A8XBA1_PLAOA|nr:PIR Superfamily Protein [Plasmodium ovale curtisi]